jgi:DNA-directed RNA polymerase specialized sigma24 family protein
LWQRYFRLLVSSARARLGPAFRRAADEEDVALSAFDSFCRGVEEGRFPDLADRDDLRRLLLLITARKAIRLLEWEGAAKRGGGRVRSAGDDEEVLAGVLSREPTPELAAQLADECRVLLERLGESDLRSIALWQMEGCTVDEIAGKLGRSPRTVARKLAEVRDRWSQES